MIFKEQNPIYIQIAERICDEILQGQYPEGERLPSVREYAIQVEVNVNTLVRSYDWLSQNDIIYNKRGLGYYVCEGAAEHIREARRNEFFQNKLPEMLQTMQQLGITMQDVKRVAGTLCLGFMMAFSSLSFNSCDNPITIAMSQYACAEKKLEAGNLEDAQYYLSIIGRGLDSTLDRKVDSLRLVVEKAIEESETKEESPKEVTDSI